MNHQFPLEPTPDIMRQLLAEALEIPLGLKITTNEGLNLFWRLKSHLQTLKKSNERFAALSVIQQSPTEVWIVNHNSGVPEDGQTQEQRLPGESDPASPSR